MLSKVHFVKTFVSRTSKNLTNIYLNRASPTLQTLTVEVAMRAASNHFNFGKDCAILICFAKRMEGSSHLGPEKSGFKVPKKRSQNAYWQWAIAHARWPHARRIRFRYAHCAWNFVRTEHKELACLIGVLAGLFGTLKPDFSGPRWPFPSILFAKHIKMTQSFERAQNWNDLKRHACDLLL